MVLYSIVLKYWYNYLYSNTRVYSVFDENINKNEIITTIVKFVVFYITVTVGIIKFLFVLKITLIFFP